MLFGMVKTMKSLALIRTQILDLLESLEVPCSLKYVILTLRQIDNTLTRKEIVRAFLSLLRGNLVEFTRDGSIYLKGKKYLQ